MRFKNTEVIIHSLIVSFSLLAFQSPLLFSQVTGIDSVRHEFIFSSAPFSECHASTIAETPAGLAVAFFAGTAEKNPDVSIWLCRQEKGIWTPPEEVANGIQNGSLRFACWNPVLFQVNNGPLLLFYKVGPNPSEWWGMMISS